MKSKNSLTESVTGPNRTGQGALRRKLRRRTAEEKRRIVEETLVPGASVAVVARRHDVNANQVFMWRREYRAGKLGSGTAVAGFIPLGVVDGDAVIRPASRPPEAAERRGKSVPSAAGLCWPVEVELRNGVKVRFGGGADEKDMRLVLQIAGELV